MAVLVVTALAATVRLAQQAKSNAAPPVSTSAVFTGSSPCRACHEEFHRRWRTSHHGLAMQPFTAAFAEKEIRPQRDDVVIRGVRYRAENTGGKWSIVERDPAGEKRYPMVEVMGGKVGG